jgi:hypothetical protein
MEQMHLSFSSEMAKVLHNSLERLVKDKHSSLSGPICMLQSKKSFVNTAKHTYSHLIIFETYEWTQYSTVIH